MNQLLPIGRFARITQLSIKALRFYADAGLLLPSYIDQISVVVVLLSR